MNSRFLFLLIILLQARSICAQETPPITEDERIEAYMNQRKDLIAKDQLSFEHLPALDSNELLLNDKLVKLRQDMILGYKEQHFFPPARYFFQSKQHIEDTDLFKILRMMPKGGILHLHGAASGNAQWVVEQVISDPNAHVFWGNPDDNYVKGQLHFFKPNEAPPGFIQGFELNQSVRNFGDSLTALLTFDESVNSDSVDIWGEFELVFQRLYGFVRYQPVFKNYFHNAFEQLLNDGIQHVELRGVFNELYHLQHPAGYFNADSSIRYFQETAQEIRRKDPAFTLKVIFTALRFQSKEAIAEKLVNAFQLRQRYPDFISGFDLVAEEDQGYSTLYFLENWLKLDSLQEIYQVDMPLYLHNGESDWVSVENLYDAVLLDSRRIGHGFNLFRFPNLLEVVKQKDICLEINPISNQVLGFIRDLRLHPGSTYLNRGVPMVISSDDPLIFNYQGLSYDFWEIFLAWELDLKALKMLTINSIKYSSLSYLEREEALQHFNERWEKFVDKALLELEMINDK